MTQKNCTPNSWQVNSRRFHLNKCCKMKRRFLHVWHGIDQTTSLTMQLMSGVDVFAHVCGQKADTSSNYCDNIFSQDAWKDSSPMTCCVSSVKPCLLIVQEYKMFVNEWQQTFQFLSNVSNFFCLFFLEITKISYFWLSQGSAATYWRYGGKYYVGFAGNLLGFPAVKEFENPLRIDEVIAMSLVYYFFGNTV